MSFTSKAKKIRLIIFDVDGVFTDGNLYYTDQGNEYKAFHVQDGLGIKLLLKSGIQVAIITSRNSSIVQRRMQELGISLIYQGYGNKLAAYYEILQQSSLVAEQIAYVGDDLPDLPVMQQVGLPIAVANAVPLIKQIADWQTQIKGGQGAVREVCEVILKAQSLLIQIQNDFAK